ncbi:MAG TPA: response regulator [Gammaproteobacteria bacterium]|nr:response regulator [Gammaproteobacteria bacterium]
MARILIVDDSPTDTHVLKTMLEKNGYDTLSVVDGEQGIATAKMEKPDLILMDVVLPGISGFQATRQITKSPETSTIPVIIVTTKDQETDRVWGLRQGAKDYITKPVSEADLIGKIKAALGS